MMSDRHAGNLLPWRSLRDRARKLTKSRVSSWGICKLCLVTASQATCLYTLFVFTSSYQFHPHLKILATTYDLTDPESCPCANDQRPCTSQIRKRQDEPGVPAPNSVMTTVSQLPMRTWKSRRHIQLHHFRWRQRSYQDQLLLPNPRPLNECTCSARKIPAPEVTEKKHDDKQKPK
jgi:hypothetical protein